MLARYQRFDEVDSIQGYVVNIFDSLNYDIDLDLPEYLQRRYSNVITNHYTYQDETGQVKSGTTYRCRLRGISVLTKQYHQNTHRSHSNYKNVPKSLVVAQRKAQIDIIRQIDRQNGYVSVVVTDVDIYRRLLIDLYDPITNLNLKELILQPEYSHVYQPYQQYDLQNTETEAEDLIVAPLIGPKVIDCNLTRLWSQVVLAS
jgi:hypothetical protein